MILLGWFALTIGALLLMRAANMPLGQGSFVYQFSQMQGERMARALWLAPIAALAALAIALSARRRKLAALIGVAVIVLLGAWTLLAPKTAIVQHSFNLRSPSQDGAFVNELYEMTSLRDYLRGFDARIQRTPAELRGTRVISNPPGTTILFYTVAHYWSADVKSPGWLERFLQRHHNVNDDALLSTMLTVQLAVLLTALWALAAVALYRASRLLLPPAGAMLCVLIAWFNPSTAHFVPGKDPVQLLTVGLLMWTWLAAWKRDRPLLAFVAGAVLLLGATLGLIHVWVAAALIGACAWDTLARRQSIVRFATHLLLPFAAGAVAFVLLVYLLADWNLAKTLFTVWRRFAQIQQQLALNHNIWLAIGLPLFLLFLSPAIVLFGALSIRRRRSLNFGARLAIVTVIVMAISYFAGVSYELPRLWVVFLPPLTLGLLSAAPLGSVRHEGRVARSAMWIAIVHILFTAAHWSMLDARESEHRLSGPEPTFFGKT